MSRPLTVAVVGATGQVGGVMRRLLDERDFPVGHIRYLASARSAGSTLPWRGADIVVEDTAAADLAGELASELGHHLRGRSRQEEGELRLRAVQAAVVGAAEAAGRNI